MVAPTIRKAVESFITEIAQLPDGTRELILNEGQAIHSIYYPDPNAVLTGWYWDYFLSAPYFNAGFTPLELHRIGIIGLAAGTIAHQFTKVYGPVPIDGVEIDPAIVNVGRTYFAMNEANLQVYIQDGRTFLETTSARYDGRRTGAVQFQDGPCLGAARVGGVARAGSGVGPYPRRPVG